MLLKDVWNREYHPQNIMLQELGIEDFDVTGDFDISDIDKTLEEVTA